MDFLKRLEKFIKVKKLTGTGLSVAIGVDGTTISKLLRKSYSTSPAFKSKLRSHVMLKYGQDELTKYFGDTLDGFIGAVDVNRPKVTAVKHVKSTASSVDDIVASLDDLSIEQLKLLDVILDNCLIAQLIGKIATITTE